MVVVTLLTASPGAAFACDFILPTAPAEREAQAQANIDAFVAIIDAEVIREPRQGHSALVRAERVFKGPQRELFEIAEELDSCDVAIGGVGSRQRLFLTGGPELWRSEQTTSDPRDEDRLLGSDREQDWPHVYVPLER